MVQNISAQGANPYGSIQKIGTTENGRVVYQVIDGNGKEAGKMSIAGKDCDVFEKSYRDIMESAPKIQKYAQTHSSPADIEKRKKISKWLVWTGAILGAGIPIYLTRKSTTGKQLFATAAGIIAGLTGGFALSIKATTPPGTMKFTKAAKNISKLDIQPIAE